MKKNKIKVASKNEFRPVRIETRGRKPLPQSEIVQKMKDELSKLIMKVEKEMMKEHEKEMKRMEKMKK